MTGLKVGESRTVTCEPKNAYGDYDASNIAEVLLLLYSRHRS